MIIWQLTFLFSIDCSTTHAQTIFLKKHRKSTRVKEEVKIIIFLVPMSKSHRSHTVKLPDQFAKFINIRWLSSSRMRFIITRYKLSWQFGFFFISIFHNFVIYDDFFLRFLQRLQLLSSLVQVSSFLLRQKKVV